MVESARAEPPVAAGAGGRIEVLGCPVAVNYEQSHLEAIRDEVVDAFYSAPHGGVEVGGLLFGTRQADEPQTIRLVRHYPIACEHARGPAFLLSEREMRALQAALADLCESEFAGLELVGWYHSHHRSGLELSQDDLTFHVRLFPHPWQVALLFRPEKRQPVRAGFFLRDLRGDLSPAAPRAEVTLDPLSYLQRIGSRHNGAAARDGGVETLAARPVAKAAMVAAAAASARSAVEQDSRFVGPPEQRAIPPALATHKPGRQWAVWLALLVLLLAGGACAAYWAFVTGIFDPRPGGVLPIQCTDQRGQLLLAWDRNDPRLAAASGALLTIEDGDSSHTAELTPQDLTGGSFTYERSAGLVRAHLRVEAPGGKVLEGSGLYLGQPVVPGPTPLEMQAIEQRNAAQREAERTAEALRSATRRTRELEAQNARLEREVRELRESLETARSAISR